MTKRTIVVAGNIGSGKTSLTERIGSRLGWKTAFESVADNPYLPSFYKDMLTWSFRLQVYFLGHRSEQYLELVRDPVSCILDRSIYEDAFIFARALNHMGNLSELDYQTYLRLYNLVVKTLPAPDLLIVLRAPVPVLMKRIQERARNMETGISSDYLALLDSFYGDWMRDFDQCPVLTIQTENLDFVHQSNALDVVIERINQKLSGKEEVVF
jgi:deoxyadenosine/deoxycytidine kinase